MQYPFRNRSALDQQPIAYRAPERTHADIAVDCWFKDELLPEGATARVKFGSVIIINVFQIKIKELCKTINHF